MEKLSYNSYPDSAGSSPRSREIDFENPPPWEEHQSYKAKFMCSYGGKIQPRPHDNQFAYVGGETKILSVDRGVKFSDMIAKLFALSSNAISGGDYSGVTFKYQLPGEDLDALISVTNDDDLEHMMHEYDRIQRGSAKSARMRLFLFPVVSPAGGFGSESAMRTEPERVVGGHSSAAARVETEKSIAAAGTNHVDFLFGLEKSIPPPVSTPPPPTFPQQVHVAPQYAVVGVDESDIRSDRGVNMMEMQNQVREFQRFQIADQQDTRHHHHQAVNLAESGGFYQKFQESRPAESVQHAPSPQMGYWSDKHVSGGAFHSPATGFSQQQVYVSDAQGNLYHYASPSHAPPQSLSGQQQQQPGQGYYNVNVHQRVSPDVYNTASNPTTDAALPVRHVAEQVYGHVMYDGSGRQVYYTAPVGGVALPPSQVHQYGSSSDGRGGVVVSQEGRVVGGVGAHVVSSSN
ncbi:PREDICTED: uncharacterized protein LOC104807191 [Tarenaya hassleriana]|uniref:uncharacterized protein LOC104807191 n=1 Tax=Tarenaya hassleriana TaxID=28532 RepID=UPI00053C8786|nr:PREDICTED: uncharacterized protein LOC104807191 [Tarenaya hassleriana]